MVSHPSHALRSSRDPAETFADVLGAGVEIPQPVNPQVLGHAVPRVDTSEISRRNNDRAAMRGQLGA